MTSSSIRKHAGTGAASDQPAVPEPAFGERARTLVYVSRIGSLSTLSRKQPGFPFRSVMPYGLDEQGRPIFLISTMAMHTQNLQADPRASLLVTQDDAGGDPLGAPRVTLVGNVLPIPQSDVAEARKLYLACYANSKYWVDFEDFSFLPHGRGGHLLRGRLRGDGLGIRHRICSQPTRPSRRLNGRNHSA